MSRRRVSLPYASATAGDRALIEMQKDLAKWGCASFGTGVDVERGITTVAFRWRDRTVKLEASWTGYARAYVRAVMSQGGVWREGSPVRAELEAEALEQGKVAVCSVLRDWCKAQITAVECGVLSFEAAFMPHMLLKDGRRVLDAARASNLLPAPADGGA